MDTPTLSLSMATNPLAYNGMVTSPHYLASQAGLAILQSGGNALESAIAVATTLAVVYPHMCTLGGDAFWLLYSAQDTTVSAINASGRAAHAATQAFYTDRGFTAIPAKGVLAANTVPGLVSGLALAYAKSKELGGRLSRETLCSSAIRYAEEGFPASTSFVKNCELLLHRHADDPKAYPLEKPFAEAFFHDGRAYRIGERMRQPDLAKSLREIAICGFESLYQGDLGEKIVRDIQAQGGLLDAKDFANHKADWVDPIHVPYRDTVAYSTPPNSQGMASLEILNILNNFDIASLSDHNPLYCHLVVEATKEAFCDRDRYLSDPAFVAIPLDALLSSAHGSMQAKRIEQDRAHPFAQPLDPHGDTVWFGVVDSSGNAVSCIQSIYHDFGSGIVPEGTGILLQNRGCYFSLDPSHVNCLQPCKRTFHTLNPSMLLRNGSPYLLYGTMGGEGQPQTQAALVTRIIDFGMTPQEAITAPRWLYGRAFGRPSNTLKIESRFSEDVRKELTNLGHELHVLSAYNDIMGHAGAIRIDKSLGSLLQGGSDPRGDGAALGY